MISKLAWRTSAVAALILGASPLMAADYSVATVRPITANPTTFDPGNGLNLYSVTAKGVDLVPGSPFVFQQTDFTGQLATVLSVVMSPAHDFVYVTYTGTSQPNVVGYAITPKGLVLEWQKTFTTGMDTLQLATLTAQGDFLIEVAHPGPFAQLVTVLNQAGQAVLSEVSENLVSFHINQNGKFFYSCRSSNTNSLGGVPPADSVVVYDLGKNSPSGTAPLVTSTDPIFVRSVCN